MQLSLQLRACVSLNEREVLLSVDNNIQEPTPNEANTTLETLVSSSKTSSPLCCIAKRAPSLSFCSWAGRHSDTR